MGGVGKSTLVNEWLRRMDEAGWRGAARVYGWSFYRQGTGEGGSSDDFFADAFQWFGDPTPAPTSPWEKGRRLARLIQEERTLLVLDGVEPLQEKPNGSEAKIQDLALASLVLTLAQKNPGLCLLTTRMPVSDLNRFSQQMVQLVKLERLSPKAGAMLLRQQGTAGRDNELETASDEYKGHALALMLLGSYLAQVANGDIRRRNEIGPLVHEEQYGGHARRVMDAYEPWLGSREQTILRMVGLFDRPAKLGEMNALRDKPITLGLNDAVVGVGEHDWNSALTKLRRIGLVFPDSGGVIDVHPLVRQHFGEKLRRENEIAWREGHRRLYEYLKNTAKPLPETIQEMAPLYAAVVHGCIAGKNEEALFELYHKRINQETAFYCTKALGAFASCVAALAAFFDPPWERLVPVLSPLGQAFAYNESGIALRALGRLKESASLFRMALAENIKQQTWIYAAKNASNLAEVLESRGALREALASAAESVTFATDSLSLGQIIITITTLAAVQHALGRYEDAASLCAKAELLQKEDQPNYPLLYSLQGFRYCDILLDLGMSLAVRQRAALTLMWANAQRIILEPALDHLLLGRAHLVDLQRGSDGNLNEAQFHMMEAISGLRHAGYQEHVSQGLLARAELHIYTGAFADAHVDLDEVMDISTHCGFRLHEADAHLGYVRLGIAEGDATAARKHLDAASKIIDDTGYHRRDREVRELEATLSKMS